MVWWCRAESSLMARLPPKLSAVPSDPPRFTHIPKSDGDNIVVCNTSMPNASVHVAAYANSNRASGRGTKGA